MTLHLPAELAVTVITDDPAVTDLADILVNADFYLEGRYYYGDLLGLTDPAGQLLVPKRHILEGFRESQLGGIMDYKVPLDRCDANATIRIPGGGDFRFNQLLVPGSAHISNWAQDIWARARNVDLAPVSATLLLDAPRAQAAVTVTVRSGPSGHGSWRRLTSA